MLFKKIAGLLCSGVLTLVVGGCAASAPPVQSVVTSPTIKEVCRWPELLDLNHWSNASREYRVLLGLSNHLCRYSLPAHVRAKARVKDDGLFIDLWSTKNSPAHTTFCFSLKDRRIEDPKAIEFNAEHMRADWYDAAKREKQQAKR